MTRCRFAADCDGDGERKLSRAIVAIFLPRKQRHTVGSIAVGAGMSFLVFFVIAWLPEAAAASLFTLGRHAVAPSPLATWASLSVLRILLAPVLAPAFLVFALFSPHRSPRFVLLAATVVEVAVGAYAGFVWFFPLFFDRN